MNVIIILGIALFLESIALLINTILLKKYLIPSNTKEVEDVFNEDEYLNSFDFNLKLDALILKFLGKFDNETITTKVYLELVQTDPNCSKIKKAILLDYIREVLKNYINRYTPEPDVNQFIYEEEVSDSKTSKNKTVNIIDNIVNDFYK